MGRINARLLEKIADKKGITVKAAYPLVTKVVQETFLERDLAALVLAGRLGVGINKYSTAVQREQVRGYMGGGARPRDAAQPPVPVAAVPVRQRSVKQGKRAKPKDNSVFVIHGRDLKLRDSMFAFLAALGCKPIEFHQAVARVRGTGNPFVGAVLDTVFEQTQALIVLFSPDEEVLLKEQFLQTKEKRKPRDQARANVIFESGMALARHEEKTIMVQVGDMASFSDIGGRHMAHLDDSFESRNAFVERLSKICKVDRSGNAWAKAGNFNPTLAPKKPQRTR